MQRCRLASLTTTIASECHLHRPASYTRTHFCFVLLPRDAFYSSTYTRRSIVMCRSVCLCEHIVGTKCPIFTTFLCKLPMARSSSGGVAIVLYFRFYGWRHVSITVVDIRLRPRSAAASWWVSLSIRAPFSHRLSVAIVCKHDAIHSTRST